MHIVFILLLFVSTVSASDTKVVTLSNDLTFSFQHIPGGSFVIGDPNGQKDEGPQKTVTLNTFYLQTHELTRAQFAPFAAKHALEKGCWYYNNDWFVSKELNWENPGYAQSDSHPVVCVSWIGVQSYIQWLNATQAKYTFRLPTEAEWEYAARAGSEATYFWGEDSTRLCEFSNHADEQILSIFPHFSASPCDDGYVRSAPVGKYAPNEYGLYDMYGNAWEWVADCWVPHYQNLNSNGQAQQLEPCERRGFRGGGWGDIPRFARSGIRNRAAPNNAKDDIGFRLVMELR